MTVTAAPDTASVRTLDEFLGRPADLRDKVVMVTGAAGGIGTAVVRALVQAGSLVAACDRDAQALAATAGERVGAYQVDVTEAAGIKNAVDAIRADFGKVDVLINGAGIIHADPLLEVPIETWRRVMAINVEGTLAVSQAVAKVMTQQPVSAGRRGMIVNISSRAATIGRPYSAAYGASKAALDHLTMSMAAALVDDRISCVSIYPGDVREGMLSYLLPNLARAQNRTVDEVASERSFQAPGEFAEIMVDVLRVPGTALNGLRVRSDRTVTALSTQEEG